MDPTSARIPIRVAVVGASDSGRFEVLEAICRSCGGRDPYRQDVGEIGIWCGEWDEIVEEGQTLPLLMRCVDEHAGYEAAQELLIREADAVVFVFDVRREYLQAGWQSLQRVADAAQKAGFDLRSRPLVLQYHRCDQHAGFQPTQMDAWLGLPPGQEQSRVATVSDAPDGGGSVFDALWCQGLKARKDA